MKRTDLAYTAGIVDGEGTIGIYRIPHKNGKASYILQVFVGNTNEWLIQWLRFAFGGSIVYRPSLEDSNHKPSWVWRLTANKALRFLNLVYPYLRLKKPQADLAIKFQSPRLGQGHHPTEEQRAVEEAQKIIMHGLNKRGIINVQ